MASTNNLYLANINKDGLAKNKQLRCSQDYMEKMRHGKNSLNSHKL